MRFSLRFGTRPYERWAPEAAEKMIGQRTSVRYEGALVRATIVGAAVLDAGSALELDLETIDPPLVQPAAPSAPDSPCERKRKFDTEGDAKWELARIIVLNMTGQRRRTRHVETGYYRCPSCRGWHLSSRPWKGKVRA